MRFGSIALLALALAACGTPDEPGRDGGVDDRCRLDPAAEGCPDPCELAGCPDDRSCVVQSGAASCVCPPGTSDVMGACAPDTVCTPTTCNERGRCEMADGVVECTCETGYDGENCELCDEAGGWLPDGMGGCDDDLCDPNPCEDRDPERARCAVSEGAVQCLCNAGTHDEGGRCVPDDTCLPTTCGGHGDCMESPAGVGCTCHDGWAGAFCDGCDEMGGYHPDGAGGCTTDACLPNPCTRPLETTCVLDMGGDTRCECDMGAHREGMDCVVDEVCMPGTCNMHGTCAVVDGRTACTCDVGYEAPSCATCDAAAGYHDDGMGGCTNDPCAPNPCLVPNRSVCSAMGMSAVCSCDAGFHDDGVGGCTTDPCLPDPCAAMGMACRVSMGGAAECYVPTCDDTNPCTDDAFVAGACRFTPRADGSSCSTTVCTSGQTCASGSCGGGSPVSCADTNPCTRDSCDATTGCSNVNDDTLVPDDMIACTTDACLAGVESHAPSDVVCDDGLFCDGPERCAPTETGADAMGCVQDAAPVPPGRSSPCRAYGACDEMTRGFPLTTLPMGASCDDSIRCTAGDVCVSAGGACVGTPVASCPDATCSTTVPWSSAVDVPWATVTGAITRGGSGLPTMMPTGYSSGFTLYAQAQDTDVRHVLGYVRYDWSSGVGYVLRSGDGALDAQLVPGVYDILYRRGYSISSSTGTENVSLTTAADAFPNGMRVLRADVVIGPGPNVLDVDVPVARVTGAITSGGAALPAMMPTGYSSGFTLYAVARDTGINHVLGYVRYDWSSGVGYVLRSGDGALDAQLMPGTYDVLYRRGYSISSSTGTENVSLTTAADAFPNGYRILSAGVVLGAGANVINLDVPTSDVTGAITVAGAAPPMMMPTGYSSGFTLYAVARDTRVRHVLGYLRYDWSSGVGYVLRSGDGTLDAQLAPGRYDVVYRRGYSISSSTGTENVSLTGAVDAFPNGLRVLQSDVMIGPGPSTLNVDVPIATITGNITAAGSALPAMMPTGYSSGFTLYAVPRDTGINHVLGYVRYDWSSGVGYVLRSGDGALDAQLAPGTYDILYRRGYSVSSSTGTENVSLTTAADAFPNGYRLVRSGVVVGAGANTVNIDVPIANVTGAITIDGAALPAMMPTGYSSGFTLYAVARDTGVNHVLGYVRYDWSSGVGYVLRSGDGALDAQLPPGSYDVLYRRGYSISSSTGTENVSLTTAADAFPNGYRILSGVTLGAGANTVNVSVPSSALTGPITSGGDALPGQMPTGYSSGFTLYAVARDTEVNHVLGYVRYDWRSGVGYLLRSGDGALDAQLAPGTYDIRYRRGYSVSSSTGTENVSLTTAADAFPNGYRDLEACVAIP